MTEIRAEKIKEMLDDKATFGKILQVINLKQEERILDYQQEVVKRQIIKIQNEISVKHKLEMLELPMLIYTFQQEEHKELIDKYKRRWKERWKNEKTVTRR